MKFKYLLATSVVGISAAAAVPAAAQSTGSVDFEDDVIVVTGERFDNVGGVEIPDTPKAKQVLDEEIIRRQRPGQTVNDIVNLVPGVSFQNNDPWGSSGGSFTIRGFGADRISQTLDGLPLNDSGNYALYTNQQVDPEVLESVNVNLGVTDVDSPTASAVGGTINIRTREPSDSFKLTATLTGGSTLPEGDDSDRSRVYMRAFGMVDTGDLTGMGTKAFVSYSYTRYNNPFNNYGKVDKNQVNGRIWQDLGDNGDFIAVSGHYNENRNNFFGSFSLDKFPETKEDRFYDINYGCNLPFGTLAAGGGAAGGQFYSDSSNGGDCGSEFDRRYNPSNTGNVRGASRFSITDALTLTVDPSYQYVKANGGGAEDLKEGFRTVGGVPMTGFLSGSYYYGRDLNGDGDLLDEVAGIDPSQTRTHRYGVISNLAYEINDDHRLRLSYTYDDANHRQTGYTGFMTRTGEPEDVFAINDPVLDVNGYAVTKRDRQSYAILHQISGEYVGHFGDLTAVLGVRAPFFTRKLNQFCYTTSASGFLDCIPESQQADYEAANPYTVDPDTGEVLDGSAPPQSRTYKYDDILPNIGFVYDLGSASVFANYAKGISVPGTDPLYDSLYFPDVPSAQPVPETTDSFDAGLRFQSGDIQAQIAGWYTRYNNRLASAYDPILEESVYRNLGRVDKYGIDGSIAWRPTNATLLYVFGSLNESEIKEDIQNGVDGDDNPIFLATGGKRESGAPTWSVGARGQVRFGSVEVGAQVKHTGKRYINDENLPLIDDDVLLYPATVDGYTLVDFDVRWNIGETPFGDDVAVQLNVTNLFDELYVGGFGGSLNASSTPFVQIGAPRAASLSLVFGF